jgi:hypothetical protein
MAFIKPRCTFSRNLVRRISKNNEKSGRKVLTNTSKDMQGMGTQHIHAIP